MGLQRPGDELSSTCVNRPVTMIQFSTLSLLPSFNIPPALKKESGLVLGVLVVGWQKDSMWNVKPWTEESGRLQSLGSQRVGHD